MKTDNIEYLFKNIKEDFDVIEPPKGHQKRFSEKLKEVKLSNEQAKNRFWLKAISVAALLILLVSIGLYGTQEQIVSADLASVSPEMQKTQSFFKNAIDQELEKLNSYNSPETKKIINDALVQIENLEKDYQKLKIDLVKSGNNKNVVYAMVNNFQNRINLLQQVVKKIEEIKSINTQRNENIL